MPNDIPDWSGAPQTFKRKLYPDGVTPAGPTTPSLSLNAGQTLTKTFTLPPGTLQIRILATAAGLLFTYSLQITGHQTVEQYYGDPNAPGAVLSVPTPTLPFTLPVESEWDTQIDVTVKGDPTNPTSYYISAMFLAESPGQAGASQQVSQPTSTPWQAATTSADVAVALASGGVSTIIAGVAGQSVYLFGLSFCFDATSAGNDLNVRDGAGGASKGRFSAVTTTPPAQLWAGAKMTQGNGVQIFANGAALTPRGSVSYAQAVP